MTTKPCPVWDLEIFWTGSPKVSDFFEGNSASKTLTKFDDHQTSPFLGLLIFWMVSLNVSECLWEIVACKTLKEL